MMGVNPDDPATKPGHCATSCILTLVGTGIKRRLRDRWRGSGKFDWRGGRVWKIQNCTEFDSTTKTRSAILNFPHPTPNATCQSELLRPVDRTLPSFLTDFSLDPAHDFTLTLTVALGSVKLTHPSSIAGFSHRARTVSCRSCNRSSRYRRVFKHAVRCDM